MSQEEETEDKFIYDQPWNPVSYFEEENEATGGNPSGSAYSPSRLASLFESNKLAVDQDIAMRKRLIVQSNFDDSSSTNVNENTDLDSLSQYTLEVDNGIKILDTTPAINQKAIFHDLDRLRRWRESTDKSNKDVYINDEETSSYLYEISDNPAQENESSLIDLNMDNILNSLPDVTNFDNDVSGVNCFGKLNELDNQINVDGNLFSIGSTNTGLINTNIITDKKNSVTDDDSDKLIIDRIIVGDRLNDEICIDNDITDLNRKNCENDPSTQGMEVVKVEDINNVNNNIELNNIDSFKDLDITDELDELFDDTDDELELPDVPTEIVDLSSKADIELTVTNEESSTDTIKNKIDSDIIPLEHSGGNSMANDGVNKDDSSMINVCQDEGLVTNLDDFADSGSDECTQNIEDILSSNETESVDAFINYVEDFTSSDTNLPDSKNINVENSDLGDMSSNGTAEECLNTNLPSSSNACLAIEDILDHIENSEIDLVVQDKNICEETNVAIIPNETLEPNTSTTLLESVVESNTDEQENLSHVEITVQNSEVCLEEDAGSSSFDTSTSDSKNSNCCAEISADVEIKDADDVEDADESQNNVTLKDTNDIQTQNDNCPLPIPKTVDVSSVHYKDSIGCLTPDDDEDIIVASSSRSNTNDNKSEDDVPGTSSIGLEKDFHSGSNDINIIESTGDVNEDIDVEAPSVDLDINDNDISNASEILSVDTNDVTLHETDSLDNHDNQNATCENLNEHDVKLDHELVAASENVEPRTVNDSENISVNDSNARLHEAPSVVEGAVGIDQNEDDIDDSVFDDNVVTGDNETPISQETNENIEPVPETTRPRPSSSIRRVRFSLDSEEPSRDDNESPAVASGSFSEPNLAASLHQGIEGSSNSSLTPEMRTLGWVAPKWIPDSDAKACMSCNTKFTVVKRRHHCRACGKVLCSQCCNMKFHLPYMDYKPVRVCQSCCDIMINALNGAAQGDQPQPTPHQPLQPPAPPINFGLPEAPPPYSETIEGLPERLGSTSSNAPPYSEAAALPRFDEQPAEVIPAGQALENLPVMRNSPFPTGPINDMMSFQLPGYSSSTTNRRTSRNRSESEMSAVIMFNSTVTNLPPILRRDNDETRIINNPDLEILMKQMNDETEDPIAFIVNKNLVVRVKVVNMDCCVEKRCWCFVSDGMGASNQEEVVIIIKCKSYDIEDLALVRKVLQQMNAIFEKAKHGNAVSDSEQMEFNPNITCMPKNTGMLFYKPTVQCLKKLFLPTSPYLFGMYIERTEIPWAKNFPLRLLLRIGAEYKYYPCPLFNVLDRPAVYDGVGRTILDLLADFRNFQYTLPRIVGVTINLRGKDTIIKLPRHRFDEVLKAVNASEENVLSLAGNFSPTCDGHLVSVEKDGRYKTQTLSIVLKENRKVTCASFFVMSAALKPDQSGIKAKASIVEDGVMVQVTSEVIQEFKTAIKEMKEYSITAGNPTTDDSSQVSIEWCSADSADRPKLTSPIDAKPFDNLTNMKIRHSYDYTSNNLTAKIHWVEVYFLPQDNDTTVQRLSARELGQMTSSIAKACMSALSPHLMTLIALEMTRIGLRVNLAANFVEYKIGANLTTLPPELLPTLDDKLVPAVHNVMSSAQERVAVELIFQLVKIV